jgi:predicted dehydrogenase
MPDRITRDGRPFHIETPELAVAVLELESGTIARLTATWYVMQSSKQGGIELHGDEGSLFLSSWLAGDAGVEYAPVGQQYEAVDLTRTAGRGIVWSRGVPEMARALMEGRRPRADGEHAAHLVEVISAIGESARVGQAIEVQSSFSPPAPMEWAI